MNDWAVLEVAIAILYQESGDRPGDYRFLMQLRDDIPGIVYPGCWGFFGGHLEPGETPEIAIARELAEEIEYSPLQVEWFGIYPGEKVKRHVFAIPLAVRVDSLVLHEGWDLGLVGPAEIETGTCYSPRARQARPLAAPHRQILRDFLARQAETRISPA